jgi:hypothetical protein
MQEPILLRASGFGNLMIEARGVTLTDLQKEELEKLKDKIREAKPLTEKQKETYKNYKARENATPELSDTAKGWLHELWLINKKGFYRELGNKYVEKGLYQEQDGIDLVSELENNFYEKNTERITKGNITGECDIKTVYNNFKELPDWRKKIDDGNTKFPLKVIKDIKCNWDPITFMNAFLSKLYETQGRTYMYLYDADEFHLHPCLVDAPAHLYEKEIYIASQKYGIIDRDTPEAQPIFDQIRRNMIFSDNPAYTKEERVKNFMVKRDLEIEAKLLEKVNPAIEYYKKIKLNQI